MHTRGCIVSGYQIKLTRFADRFVPGSIRERAGELAVLTRLYVWSALLFMCLAGANAAAADAVFDGSTVANCSLSSKTYSCNAFPLSVDTDKMTIADGFTVVVNGNAVFTYNQGLKMSGSATLNASGNLNIGDINPPNLSITGGNLVSGRSFTIGNQAQSITANVSAVTMNLGSGSTTSITGNVIASGNITVGSHCTITGRVSGAIVTTNSPVTITGDVSATKSFALASGSKVSGNIVAPVVTTDSPVTIVGNVTASTSFTLASGSTVSGDIVSPTVSLLASQSTVNGKITATTSLQLGDKVKVTGDVSAGNLTLDSANAMIDGNATVDHATLNSAGRVTKMIYCTGGTTSGQCDCVTNNSGFPVNTAQGPHCAAAPSTAPIDHFLIVHDGSASACTPEPVTVKACANAACSSYYTGGVTVNLQPGGGNVTIGSSGVSINASVDQSTPGSAMLAVTSPSVAATAPLQCSNTANGTSSCSMVFNGSVGLSLAPQDQYSANVTSLVLQAMASDPKTKSCRPAFIGQQKTIQLSCIYKNPAAGGLPVKVSSRPKLTSTDSSFLALNGADASAGLCNGSNRDFQVTFDNNGSVEFSMSYADVGKLTIAAKTSDNSAPDVKADVIFAPAGFQIVSFPALTKAGQAFTVVARALNADGTSTPNFGLEKDEAGVKAETILFSLGDPDSKGCSVKGSNPGVLNPAPPPTSLAANGIAGSITYTEAGAFNIKAGQASDKYLGGAKTAPAAVQTSLGTASGCGAIMSVPAYFTVKESRVGSNKANFYYSGEPVDVTVTAMNALGGITTRYHDAFGYSKPVVLTAFDAAGTTPIPASSTATAPFPNPGALSGTGSSGTMPLPASAFVSGIATLLATSPTPLVFTFANSPSLPLKVRLRAAETAAGGVSSKDAPAGGEDIYEARSGRVTIASRFGSAKGDLALPVTLQYWTGSSWIQNLDDNDGLHPIPTSAIAIQAASPLLPPALSAAGIAQDRQVIRMTTGSGSLSLHPTGGTGTATVAINLGAAATDTSCLPTPPARPTTTGAKMPWLRGPNGICAGAAASTADPAARATFGVYTPETRRLIHTREVFN